MAKARNREKLETPEYVFLINLFLSPILITPWINFDPVNIPRLVLLSTLAAWSLTCLIQINWKKIARPKFEATEVLIALLVLSLTGSFFLSDANLTLQFYGAQGRNAGFLAWISLLLLLLVSTRVRFPKVVRPFNVIMYTSCVMNICYGIVQSIGRDPIRWQNRYTPVVGMLGNPNFYSAFLAICSLFLLSRMLFLTRDRISWLFVDLVLLFSTFYLQSKTASIQGILMIVIGSIFLLFMRLRFQRFRILSRLTLIATLLFGLFLFTSFLGKGPLGGTLSQSTLKLRLYFWEAAFKMGLEKPFTGFGVDSFGEWYRTYRSQSAIDEFGAGIFTDSAHSTYFDVLSGSGLVAFILLIALNGYIFIKVIKYVLTSAIISQEICFLIAAWMAFLAQSTISVNSLAISAFGFSIGGILLSETAPPKQLNYHAKVRGNKLILLSGVILGLAASFPSFLSDANFRKVISQNDGQKMIDFSQKWPVNDFQILVLAKLFYSSGYQEFGQKLTYEALAINPRNVNAWLALIEDSELKKSDKILAISKLRAIDPKNRNFQELTP